MKELLVFPTAIIMFRRALSLSLALLIFVPPRALAWLMLLSAPAPTKTDHNTPVAAPVKVCPCTGQSICKCCDCCSEPSENEDPSNSVESTPAKQDNVSPNFRCRCKTPESLEPVVDYFANPRPWGIVLHEPPQVDTLAHRSDSWSSFSSLVDPPPPRKPV